MKILLAGVLGGIIMFIWTSIAHMALPTVYTASYMCIQIAGFLLVRVVAALLVSKRGSAV
jgi:hypothetical protein